jgi:hypothetical protein
MGYLCIALVLFNPATLCVVALVATALATRFYRSRCPQCQQRGLKAINFVRATVIINGQRAPDHWADYECEMCGAVVRWHHDQWEPTPANPSHRTHGG